MSDSFLGIPGYRPADLRGVGDLVAAHGARLSALVGRPLTRGWLLWDLHEDTWFADAPVLLELDGVQLEIQHSKFDDLSLTWSTVDPRAAVAFPDMGPDVEFDLVWRDDAVKDLSRLHGQHVLAVDLVEWRGADMANGMVAVSLTFEDGRLTVENALDENGLHFGALPPEYRVLSRRASGDPA